MVESALQVYIIIIIIIIILIIIYIYRERETGDIAQWFVKESEIKSEDPGFDPLVRQGEGQFFFCPSAESTLVPDPPAVRTQMCAHVKDLISICRKRVVLWKHENITHRGKESWAAPYCFSGENSSNSRALHWDKKVI